MMHLRYGFLWKREVNREERAKTGRSVHDGVQTGVYLPERLSSLEALL